MANGKVFALVLALLIAVFVGISSMFQVAAWEKARNSSHATVYWRFTTQDARIKLHKLYPSIDVC